MCTEESILLDGMLNGMGAITDYVTDLFNVDVSEVCVSKDAIKMIEHLNSRQKTLLKKRFY